MKKSSVSLRELLENPSLLEAPAIKGSNKLALLEDECVDSSLAFLGPNLWDFGDILDFPDFQLNDTNCLTSDWMNMVDVSSQNINDEVVETTKPTVATCTNSIINGLCDPTIPLKCIVGENEFNPAEKRFKIEELSVAPILPKSKKVFVPSDKKDDLYWTRRVKNNTAAKRSRETRRMTQNQIALRTAYLEEENELLKKELEFVKNENNQLKEKLAFYELHL